MKYAIVESGGKQYKAVEGSTIEVDLLPSEAAGNEVILSSVMLLVDGEKVSVGTPYVKGAEVKSTVLAHTKGPKVVIFKYSPKKRMCTGHVNR